MIRQMRRAAFGMPMAQPRPRSRIAGSATSSVMCRLCNSARNLLRAGVSRHRLLPRRGLNLSS